MPSDPTSAYTKSQVRAWIENAVKKAQQPDLKEMLKRERQKRTKIVAKSYGF